MLIKRQIYEEYIIKLIDAFYTTSTRKIDQHWTWVSLSQKQSTFVEKVPKGLLKIQKRPP